MTPDLHTALTRMEAHLLSAMWLDPALLDRIGGALRVDDFGDARHRAIFAATLKLAEQRETPDPVSLDGALASDGRMPADGRFEYLADIYGLSVDRTSVDTWVQRVKRGGKLRRAAASAVGLTERLAALRLDDADKLDSIISAAFADVGLEVQSTGEMFHRDAAREVIADLSAAQANPAEVAGVKTGFVDLDDVWIALEPGNFIVVGARPGMGKTAFGVNLARNIAKAGNGIVVYFSTEIRAKKLAARALGAEAMVNTRALRTGKLTDTEVAKLVEACHGANTWGRRLLWVPVSGPTPMVLRRTLRQVLAMAGMELEAVFVDHMHQMRPSSPKGNEEAELKDVSGNLLQIGQEFGAPMIALAQLSRECETRPNKRPILKDLRYSGAIEQDADIVAFLYRDERYNPQTDEPNVCEVINAKVREGESGTVKLGFDAATQRFFNLAKDGWR